MKSETFKGENVDELIRLRLNRLKSVKLCEKVIRLKLEEKSTSLSNEIIQSKARGLASVVESAIGYWNTSSSSLNSKVLSRYYFLLQMSIAEQVGSIDNSDDLASIQRHTENGHGLGTIRDYSKHFPDDFYTFVLTNGHFHSYLKSLSIPSNNFAFERRPRKFEEVVTRERLININELFRRIPELNAVIEEHTGQTPLSFHVGHSELNIIQNQKEIERHFKETREFVLQVPSNSTLQTTLITIYTDPSIVPVEYIKSLGLPFFDYQIETDSFSKKSWICGKFSHTTKYWHQALNTYSSGYAPTSVIAPLWGISDPIAIHLTLLYTLSIIVRYLPDLWREIQSGTLDHYGSLIEYYTAMCDHILPIKMLERITNTDINIHQPGSILGPI